MRLLFTTLLLIPSLAIAQFSGQGDRVLGVDYMYGFIYKHKKQISHLITDHPRGVRVTLNRKTFGDQAWHQRYNYPDVGLTFIYLDYNDSRLGESIALIPHFNIYLTKNKKALSQWKYQIGLGLGYNTNKYDKVENNQNNVLGTDFNFGIALQLQHEYKILDRVNLINSLSLTHFSNGSIKKPNSGINTISFNTGISYTIKQTSNDFILSEDDEVNRKGFGYTATLSFGMHEATQIGAGSYPFFVLSGLVDKTLNHKSKLGLALEWFYSESIKNDIIYDYRLDENENPDFNRIGLALSHELCMGKYSVMSQIGYYVYDPYEPFAPFYVRAGLRRYFNNLYASLSVKSHYAKAEAAEFAIGWRFK